MACKSTSAKDSQVSSNLELTDHSGDHHSSIPDGNNSTTSSAPQPLAPHSKAGQWLADQAEKAAELGHSYCDGVVDWGLRLLRDTFPMPCMVVKRRSALRVRLIWHGFAQPVGKPRAVQTCEVAL